MTIPTGAQAKAKAARATRPSGLVWLLTGGTLALALAALPSAALSDPSDDPATSENRGAWHPGEQRHPAHTGERLGVDEALTEGAVDPDSAEARIVEDALRQGGALLDGPDQARPPADAPARTPEAMEPEEAPADANAAARSHILD